MNNNLPNYIIYSDRIKEIVIRKFPGIIISGDNSCITKDYYYISFTEIVESQETIKRFLLPDKIVTHETENHHIIPFSFKTYDTAKDFAQYIPGMIIGGYRFSKDFPDLHSNISYETFKIKSTNIYTPVYIKFTDETSHKRVYIKSKNSGELTQYYGNDLDKYREPSGKFFEYNKLVVDYFFTDLEYDITEWCIITNSSYKHLGDIEKYENENTHKFILIENTNGSN